MVAPREPYDPDDDDDARGGGSGRRDVFRPPEIPTEVSCLHCGEVYDSYLIEWRDDVGGPDPHDGAWCCPTPGCDGLGFLFDIWPTDPEWRDEEGNKVCSFDDDDFPDDEDAFDDDDGDDDFRNPGEFFGDDARQPWEIGFDPTWGDPSNDLPPDPMPPRRTEPPDADFDQDDIPF